MWVSKEAWNALVARVAALEIDVGVLENRQDVTDLTSAVREVGRIVRSTDLNVEELVGTAEDIRTLIATLNTTTTAMSEDIQAIADRIQRLLDKINDGGMNAQTEAEIKTDLAAAIASLEPLATRLDEMGSNPDNPVPPAP